jgi:hypothetical protein
MLLLVVLNFSSSVVFQNSRNTEVQSSLDETERRHRGELERARQDCHGMLAKLEADYKAKVKGSGFRLD